MYVLVLLTALLVTVLGLAAVSVQASVRKRAADSADGARAAALARSGLELAAEMIRSEGKKWRNELKDEDWATDLPLGTMATDRLLTITAVDPVDGRINNKDDDPLDITAIVTVGDALRAVTVRLEEQDLPSRSLAAAITARGEIRVTGGATLAMSTATGQPPIAAARGTVTADGGTITGEAESATGFSGAGFTGGTRRTAWPREVPEWDDVFDAYEDDAREIKRSDLPNLLGLTYYIDNEALGPGRNPFDAGKTQAQGLYRIKMDGRALVISNSRIVGTLIVEDVSSVRVMGSVSWEPAVVGYPALVADGNVVLMHGSSNLSESGRNTNFNPSGVPASGVTDNDESDSYPSRITGLVYSDKTISGASSNATVRGPIIAYGDVTVGWLGGLNVQFDDTTWDNPPPGFDRELFGPVHGSFVRVVDE